MENRKKRVTYLSEEIKTEILARLPLRSIPRFKMMCKTWKSILESLYFRRLFLSLHQNKSRSWLLVCDGIGFMIDFHRCQTWDLPKSLGYYFQNLFQRTDLDKYTYMDSSNGLVLIERYDSGYYVGNPILQQWVAIPIPTPYSCITSLVTRVDEDGVVLSFKVVSSCAIIENEDRSSSCLRLCVYSSETAFWTRKELHCPYYFNSNDISLRLITLQGMLYIYSSINDKDVIIAHDFYGESNMCQVIPLPDHDSNNNQIFKRTLTTSPDCVIYMKILDNNDLKVWRLVNGTWELMWNTLLQNPFDDYEPLTMNPFSRNIVYLWSHKNKSLVSCNLESQSYHIFINQDGDLQNCFINHSVCEKHIDGLCALYLQGSCRIRKSRFDCVLPNRFEYVLPRWMGSVPCPPQAEILDTTSLLSHNFEEKNGESS